MKLYLRPNLRSPLYIWLSSSARLLRAMSQEKKKTRKHGNCECIATWGSPMPRSPYLVSFRRTCKSNLKSLSLSVAVLWRFYCWYVTLRCDRELWPCDLDLWLLTLNLHSIVCVPNLSAIRQSADELLQFEYLKVWPWGYITCCAMLWDSLSSLNSVKLSVHEI